MAVPQQEDDGGVRAAGRYLRLAARALLHPALRRFAQYTHLLQMSRLPAFSHVSRATATYLLCNVILYSTAGAAFLLPVPGIHIRHTGMAVVDIPALHVLWGVTALVVCASQVAALLSNRWAIWQVCAVSTAVWASAWAVVTVLMAHLAGNYGGAVVWLWIVVIHFLFISNQLTPYAPHGGTDGDGDGSEAHHTPEEEAALLAELARVANEPPPTSTPPTSTPPTRS